MLFVVWGPLVLQLLIPLSLLAWLAFGRPSSRGGWALRVLIVACYLAAIAGGGLWLIVPWYTPIVYAGLFTLAAFFSRRNARSLPAVPSGSRKWAAIGVMGMIAALFAGLAMYVVSGWRRPADVVELSFPLREGTYLVVNGGGNALINAHYGTLEKERLRRWRGQSYGVDILKINGLGFRARGILPRHLPAYEIFGEPLYAPCGGEVVAAMDGVREMTPPEMDRQNMAGNHIILKCGEVWVLLGHLQRGSVRVVAGQRVPARQVVARVGNTGNTGEPHLHIHAQRPGTEEVPLSGDPLPVVFDGRYLVRNARILK